MGITGGEWVPAVVATSPLPGGNKSETNCFIHDQGFLTTRSGVGGSVEAGTSPGNQLPEERRRGYEVARVKFFTVCFISLQLRTDAGRATPKGQLGTLKLERVTDLPKTVLWGARALNSDTQTPIPILSIPGWCHFHRNGTRYSRGDGETGHHRRQDIKTDAQQEECQPKIMVPF